jgi:8-oxo-dGTP diphosphatase
MQGVPEMRGLDHNIWFRPYFLRSQVVADSEWLLCSELGSARHSWMDVTGKPRRVHARIFDVAEDGAVTVVLNAAEHDSFVWTADPAPLGLAEHVRH